MLCTLSHLTRELSETQRSWVTCLRSISSSAGLWLQASMPPEPMVFSLCRFVSGCPFICPSTHPSIHPSVCLSICLSICLPIHSTSIYWAPTMLTRSMPSWGDIDKKFNQRNKETSWQSPRELMPQRPGDGSAEKQYSEPGGVGFSSSSALTHWLTSREAPHLLGLLVLISETKLGGLEIRSWKLPLTSRFS